MISTMPPEDASEARNYKHPFTASEIFATELNPVFEKFFEAPEDLPVESAEAEDDAEPEATVSDKEEEPAKDILFEDGEENEKVEEGQDLLNQLLEEKESEAKEIITEMTAQLSLDDKADADAEETTPNKEAAVEVKEEAEEMTEGASEPEATVVAEAAV
jgi:hypothetical protein